jgi:hypothetical protein
MSKWPFPPGCGPCCRGYEPISGTCSHHYTEEDKIVDRVTSGFKRDLQAIMKDNRDEGR